MKTSPRNNREARRRRTRKEAPLVSSSFFRSCCNNPKCLKKHDFMTGSFCAECSPVFGKIIPLSTRKARKTEAQRLKYLKWQLYHRSNEIWKSKRLRSLLLNSRPLALFSSPRPGRSFLILKKIILVFGGVARNRFF